MLNKNLQSQIALMYTLKAEKSERLCGDKPIKDNGSGNRNFKKKKVKIRFSGMYKTFHEQPNL